MLFSDNTTLYYEVHVGSEAVKAQLRLRIILILPLYKFKDRYLTDIIPYNGKKYVIIKYGST